ncbi:uncharacterized protein PHACADRAFT_254665 [Phanerochaete carnosa HHB-10118-sp]|uniref:Plus3 domain-containing protein n=1 Tax=Phanerochaete carnosa (strain HHB-10118-sp) TaxID=650164 RepID=K5WDJ4_PHACS|nr:uncharacterized protein PHACADRAFT_254665 [Phanerochaete carnosa HHB-10118-sp]EKM57104.1 hypothetical protein PHACADRAFT_254665 [Phanerochaete carnosa HHB-10118-sp]
MSDSEGDFSDELLELAGATEKKRRKRQADKSMKRRRADAVHSDSESDHAHPASDKDDNSNPYPLEGKYIDDTDRSRLMEMTEIEREDILAQRQEEIQRIQDKRNLDAMLRDRTGTGEDSVSKAAKRQHAQRGATREKSRKLDELKAKRKAKDEKKRTRTDSPRRDRSSSPMDMETSDDEEEDGQIDKYDIYDDKERRSSNRAKADDAPAILAELMSIFLTRDQIAKNYYAPWFEDLVKGAWVRYCIGYEDGHSIYRACEIVEVAPKLVTPYKINEQPANQELILRHGVSEKSFPMNMISNSNVTDKEWNRVVRVCEAENVKLPTQHEVNKKFLQIKKLTSQALTEADISVMITRKTQMNKKQNAAQITLEKSRLNQARTLALRRNDLVEVADIDAKLIALTGETTARPRSSQADELARLNERNRKANIEAARKADMLESERKRRERKLAHAHGAATPDRVRMLKNGDSRPGTPGVPISKTEASTPAPRSESPAGSSSTKPGDTGVSFETSVLDDVDIDLGDF